MITSATYQRLPLFHDWQTGRVLVKELRIAAETDSVDSLAWVIMPDHFHWLFVLQETTLDEVMRKVKSRSALAINFHLRRSGKVWQEGYHDHALRAEENIKEIARYIIANPLRAGMVKNAGDYLLWDAAWL